MKTISNETYKRVKRAFADFVDEQENPYEYLYKVINGVTFQEHKNGGFAKSGSFRLNYANIKDGWDNTYIYMLLAKLATFIHYKGNIIEVTKGRYYLIDDYDINTVCKSIRKKLDDIRLKVA